MKAIVHKKYGSPAFLEIGDYDQPVPKENEVLVKVMATTVNRTDCAMLRARPWIMRLFTGLFKPKNSILGTDFAGKVQIIGKGVQSFKIGDKVFGLNDAGLHSHAEYLVVQVDTAILKIPKNIGFDEAAASMEGAHYAFNFINKVNLKGGQKILVNGATGAIGSAMVQLLKFYGAHITAVCKGDNFELVKSLGANEVIDYTISDFTQINTKFDFVFDAVGKSSFGKCKPLLENKGVYISSEMGWMAQNLFYALRDLLLNKLPFFQNRKKVIFPYPSDMIKSLQLIKELMEQDKFKSVIDRNYPFKEIVKAYKYVEKGDKLGNVVINYNR